MIMYRRLSEGIKINETNKTQWEDVIQFEEVEGIWKIYLENEDKYYLVSEEGTVASWLMVVYELPQNIVPMR